MLLDITVDSHMLLAGDCYITGCYCRQSYTVSRWLLCYCRQTCTVGQCCLRRAVSSLRCRWWPSVSQSISVRQMNPISGVKARALTREQDLSELLLRGQQTSASIQICLRVAVPFLQREQTAQVITRPFGVAQLVQALVCRPEDRRFDSPWGV
jgi:hypothetical protein